MHLVRCEFPTLEFLLDSIKTGLASISGPIVEESVQALKKVLNFAMAKQSTEFISQFSVGLRDVALLTWELLLNRRLKQVLNVGPVLCSLAVMRPEIVGFVREKVYEVIPDRCDEHFEKIHELLGNGERNGAGLSLSVHLQALLADLEPLGRTFQFGGQPIV
jgi:hypothetical protein